MPRQRLIALARGACPFLALTLAVLTGCSSFGPDMVYRDHFNYANELRTSAQEQLLLNALALRYGEAPMFLEVSSVISTYEFEGSVNAGASFSSRALSGDSQNLGASGRYREQPTVTYTPLSGEKFTKSLLSPIPPVSLFSLVQSGWPTQLIFAIAVRSINGVSAPSRMRVLGGEGDKKYDDLVNAMQRVQFSQELDVRIEHREGGATAMIFFGDEIKPGVAADMKFIRETLGLDPGLKEFSLVYGRQPGDGSEIAVLTKSMLEILGEIGAAVEVPAEHLGEGRVQYVVQHTEDALVVPLKIQSGTDKPDDAVVKVRFRDHWFWVSDLDYSSKRTFMFVSLLLSLAETGSARPQPVITVPAS